MKKWIHAYLVMFSLSLSAETTTYYKSVYSLPLTLDPIKMNDTSSQVVGNLIYEGLVRFSDSLIIEPALAESWSTSQDGKKIIINLRNNIKFSNGIDITVTDVEYSLRRTLTKESRVRKYYDCIEGANEKFGNTIDDIKVGIRIVNSRSIEINLKNPYPKFMNVLAGATAKILPKGLISNPNFFKSPVSSGPFVINNIGDKNKQIPLSSNHFYFRGKPLLDKIILIETSEYDAKNLARTDKLHDLSNWPLSVNDPIFEVGKKISSTIAATWIIGLNTKLEPFTTISQRESFRSAVDSEKFRTLFYKDAKPAFGYVPPGIPGYKNRPNLKPNEFPKLNKKKISIAIPDSLEKSNQIKLFLETSLRENGWNVEVLLLSWDKLMAGYNKKTFQAFLVSMNMDYPDPEFLLKVFESNNPDNFSSFSNKTFDELLSLARKEPDRVKRMYINEQAIHLLNKSALTVNLMHPSSNYWIHNCIEGFKPNILSDVYIDYSKVSMAKCPKSSL